MEAQQANVLIFLVLVFGTVVLLSQLIIVPTFGTGRQEAKRLKKRLAELAQDQSTPQVSLVRQKFLKQLSPWEQKLEQLPGMDGINDLLEQGGYSVPAYRLVFFSILLGALVAFPVWLFTRDLSATGVSFATIAAIPLLKLRRDRAKRLEKFEEQLPEALDLMSRAMRAGHPFNVAMSYISKEMNEPISKEFGITFDEINYGRDINIAFQYLLARVPSMSLMAMVTAILIQRETGGNLAEVLSKIADILRDRFKLHRHVRTVTAEGRLAAWILALVPLILFAALYSMNPEYYEVFFSQPTGHKMIVVGVTLLAVGMYWISRLINIKV